MVVVEINTAQNVTIQYEIPTLLERILAYIIDALLLWISIGLVSAFFGLAFEWSQTREYAVLSSMIIIFLFYNLISEIWLDGQTLGKKLMKIKTVKLDGREMKMNDYLVRWAFRSLDIYLSIGSLALMLISSTEKNQRMGDILSNTVVIKQHPALKLDVNDILKMRSSNEYIPIYPLVTRLTEEDMLLVKNVFDRVKKYPNPAHQQALEELCKKVATILDLNKMPADKLGFIKAIINDYVVLTR